MNNWSDDETDDPTHADRRNFYKVEKWSQDGLRVELMLYAGNNLDKARRIFERTTKHRPRVDAGPSNTADSHRHAPMFGERDAEADDAQCYHSLVSGCASASPDGKMLLDRTTGRTRHQP